MSKRWFAGLFWFVASNLYAETINEVIRFQAMGSGRPPIDLQAELRIPTNAKPPYKTIILQHSSGPNEKLLTFNGRTDRIALTVGQEAAKRGYAVIYTDSFTPRDIERSHRIDSKDFDSRELIRDLFFLVRKINLDPRLDKNNLFLFGHSLGGSAAREVSYSQTWSRARWLGSKQTPFNAVVSSAPGCHINRVGVIRQPMKIIIGEKDDWTPAEPCLDFVKEQRALGSTEVEIELIPNTGHSYSSHGTSWNAQAVSFRGCSSKRVVVREDGRYVQGEEVFDHNEYKKRCHTRGATSFGPGDLEPAVAEKVLSYFDKHLTR